MAWFDSLPDTLTYDNNGQPAPLREHPFVKESPDMGHFVNRAFNTHRELGSRIPVRFQNEEEKARWKQEHLPKLWEAGLLPKPPADPKEYGIARPEGLPKGLEWSEERAGKFASTLHKYGVPKEAAGELMQLHLEGMADGQKFFQGGYDDAVASLKREYGDKYDERFEQASRLVKGLFKPEELEAWDRAGLGNHPQILSVLMRLAPLAEQDSSAVPGGGRPSATGTMSAEQVRAEVADIMSNPNNPRHKLYHLNDQATMDYINGLYQKAYGSGQVTIS